MIEDSREIERAGRTYVVRIVRDENADAPWENSDGHGPVSAERHGPKAPGEWLLCGGRQSYSKRYYDAQAAMAQARRDSWGLAPAQLSALTDKLGRAPTRGDICAEAVRLDFEYLRAWLRDEWWYVGVVVTLRDEHCCNSERACMRHSHLTESLWGIESNAGDEYLQEVTDELIAELAHR